MEVRVLLEKSHHLGGAFVAKRQQRCLIRHKLGVQKVTRCVSKEFPHDTRNRRLRDLSKSVATALRNIFSGG